MDEKTLVPLIGIVLAIFGFIFLVARRRMAQGSSDRISRLAPIGLVGFGLAVGALGGVLLVSGIGTLAPYLFLFFSVVLVGGGVLSFIKKPNQ